MVEAVGVVAPSPAVLARETTDSEGLIEWLGMLTGVCDGGGGKRKPRRTTPKQVSDELQGMSGVTGAETRVSTYTSLTALWAWKPR